MSRELLLRNVQTDFQQIGVTFTCRDLVRVEWPNAGLTPDSAARVQAELHQHPTETAPGGTANS